MPSVSEPIGGQTVAECDQRGLIWQTFYWQIVGLILLTSHILLAKLSLAFYPLAIVLFGWIFARASLAGFIVFMQTLLYQNMLISIFSSDMDPTTFSALQGTNFACLAVMAVVASFQLLPLMQRYRQITVSLLVAFGILILYTGIGAIKAGPTSAIVYFREFASPLLAGIVGIELGRVWGFRTVGVCLLYSFVLAILLSIFEYCYPIDFYTAIDEVRYLQLKYFAQPTGNTFYTAQDIVVHYTSVFFNITAGSTASDSLQSFRFGGTIINPISNGYVIAVSGIVAIALKRSFWLLILVPMLVMEGVKGANILLLISVALFWVWAAIPHRPTLVVTGLVLAALYIGVGIFLGLRNDDFHVLGFMGGVHALMHDPIGHGVGVGGNLSSNANAGFKWTGRGGFVNGGVDFAVESAIGVLIYQMGVAAAAILGVFATFLWQAPLGDRIFLRPLRSDIVFLALAMIVVNGVFQEEAFAPYAAGLLMLLAGVLIGNQRRPGQIVQSRAKRYARLAAA